MRITRIAMTIGFALSAYACNSVECDTPRDCIDPLTCEDHKCVRNTHGNLDFDSGQPPPDVGVRADGGDAGADGGDAMTPPPADGGDAGDAGDAGRPMVLDGGRIEYDGGTDGGVAPIVTLPSGGILIYSELRSTVDEAVEVAEIIDRSLATYSVLERRFPDANGNDCTVTTTRFAGGSELGFVADHLSVLRLGGPRVERIYSPVPGRPGRFEDTAPLEGRLFNTPGDFGARVVSTHVPGTLDDAPLGLEQPPASIEFAVPTPGTTLNLLAQNPMLSFAMTPSTERVIVEAVDANREVVLHCELPTSATSYLIPDAAINAWYSESPALPAYLEVAYVVLSETPVGIVGTTMTVPVKARSASGVRYPLQ